MNLLRFIILILVFAILACTPTSPKNSNLTRPRPDQALVTLYLSNSGFPATNASFVIDQIALQKDSTWIDLGLPPRRIGNASQNGGQILLGLAPAPPGDHRKMRFRISRFQFGAAADALAEKEKTVVVNFPDSVTLVSGDSKCLFIDWQLPTNEPGAMIEIPKFKAWGQGQTLGGDLVYVACDQIGTVYAIRADINEVVASFGLPAPLGEIEVDRSRRRVLILSPQRRSIYIYDAINSRLIDQVSLSRTVEPRHLALSDNGRQAFVSDAATGLVLRVDLELGTIAAQSRIGHHPHRLIFYRDGRGKIAVTDPVSQQVFILDSETLQTLRIIPVGIKPMSAVYFNGDLYIAEQGTHTVTAFEESTGRQLATINVGLQPEYLRKVDDNKALVSNSAEDSLSVLVPGQATSFRQIKAGPHPTTFAISKRRQQIFVANRDQSQITVIDLPGETILQSIPLGGRPLSIAVLD